MLETPTDILTATVWSWNNRKWDRLSSAWQTHAAIRDSRADFSNRSTFYLRWILNSTTEKWIAFDCYSIDHWNKCSFCQFDGCSLFRDILLPCFGTPCTGWWISLPSATTVGEAIHLWKGHLQFECWKDSPVALLWLVDCVESRGAARTWNWL